MNFPLLLQILAGPILGAVIGLFTNYIAVKMLFRPLNEVKIGKLTLPFTPGIIPRRKAALAKALGKACSESLIREEDLKRTLLSENFCTAISNGVLALPSVRESGSALFGEEKYGEKREMVLNYLTDRIVSAIKGLDMTELITAAAPELITAIAGKNPLIGMFVNESLIASLAPALAERLNGYLAEGGKERLRDVLDTKLAPFEEKPLRDIFKDPEKMKEVIVGVYRQLVERHADSLTAQFHIDKIVEDKVNAMPAKDLEQLVLSVMKKELNSVIWLGGIIGLIIGLFGLLADLF